LSKSKSILLIATFSLGIFHFSCFAQTPNIQNYKDGVPSAPFRIDSPKVISVPKDQRPVITSFPEIHNAAQLIRVRQKYKDKFDPNELAMSMREEEKLSLEQARNLESWKKSVRMEIEDHLDRSNFQMRGQKCKISFWVSRDGKPSNFYIYDSSSTLFSLSVFQLVAKIESADVFKIPQNIPLNRALISFVLRSNPLYIIAPEKRNSKSTRFHKH
jgi:hypothetical protein